MYSHPERPPRDSRASLHAAGAAGSVASLRLLLLACHVHKSSIAADLPRGLSASPEAAFEQFWRCRAGRPMAARAEIVNSVCPRLCHVYDVKLAVLLVLLGGVPVVHEATPTRGESHMLLIGDPGTGKSQIIKFAARLAPRFAPPAPIAPAAPCHRCANSTRGDCNGITHVASAGARCSYVPLWGLVMRSCGRRLLCCV